MLVSCPQCSSRYQLGDDKIRSSGTKVRCPRCQHTFKVFKTEEPQDDLDERTELATRKVLPKQEIEQTVTRKESPEVSKPTAPRQPSHAASAPETFRVPKTNTKPGESDSPFRAPKPSFEDAPKTNMKRPFKDAAKPKQKYSEDSEETPVPNRDETPTPRPFGDATFLAIQRMGTVKKGKRKTLIAASVIIALIATYFVISRNPPAPVSERASVAPPSTEPIKLRRPKEWYSDDPAVFQKFLAGMATMPPSEQSLPKNRSMISEALVLNGLYTGNFDQVAQGVGFASGLIATNPVESYGFYAMTTYSMLKDDVRILTDLVNRWPKANRDDLEFKLAATFVGAREGHKVEALEMMKSLLESTQMAERVQIIGAAVIAEDWNEANQVLGDKLMAQVLQTYQKKRESMKSAGAPLPDLFNVIDRKIQRKISQMNFSSLKEKKAQEPAPTPMAQAPAKQAPARAPRAATPQAPAPVPATPAPAPAPASQQEMSMLSQQGRADDDSVTKRLNERAANRLAEAKSQRPQVAELEPQKPVTPVAPQPPPAKAQPKKLPKPSADLIAAHKQEVKDESDAGKLYKQGLAFLDQRKESEAILAFQKSLRLDSGFADSYKKLGEIYMRKNDKDKALRSFKIYLELKPESSDKQLVEGWISSLQ